VANPLLVMGIYVFAFAVLFRGRVSADGGGLEYTAYVLAALAPWIALTEVLGRAPMAVLGNANLVKQIVFPSQVLPLKVALGALPTLGIGLGVALLLAALAGHAHPLGWLLLPIPIAAQLLMSSGLAFLLAALGVFVRDIKDVVGVLLTVGLFLHPIVYAPGAVPRALDLLFHASPFSYLLWCYRDAVFHGAVTEPWTWLVMVLLSAAVFGLGYRVYRMLQPSFGNAL
jgi:lipopolysaccharide transport system permease protein